MPTLLPGIILLLILVIPPTLGRPFLDLELTRFRPQDKYPSWR